VTETVERHQASTAGTGPPAGDPSAADGSSAQGAAKEARKAGERPSLAPNVVLRGEMQDSAFEQQPWLAEREGTYVQLTELLYRVAEQADGKKSLEEMASGVAEATGRGVSADNVRQLLESKLIPLGLVTAADGSVVHRDGQGPRSPLQINMRVKMLGPQWIEPFTAVLQWLYWPPVLIGVLAAALAGQAWLFFIHGLAGSVRDALYHPGLMLALLGMIVVGTVIHEFGHASALRYGGGRVKGMGAGLYLVYPAFYTDVSDNYRLPRWSRIRTDLGGFYFNLIFSLVMIGLYAVTGQSFLLLIVLLTDIEIVHQTLPFVRLDGYWALADLTGLPDFFSQMMPFIRSIVPFVHRGKEKMAPLKTWVKVVFAVYICITVPLLVVLLFFMLKSVPRVLATGWDSASVQLQTFSHAQAAGDMGGMAAAAVQLLILGLPTLGLVYMLVKLGRRIAGGLWSWSKGSAPKRVAASGIMAGLVALLTWLWLPQVPLAPRGTAGPFYSRSTWQPIGPQERGTIRDAAPAVVGWRVPGNTSRPPVGGLNPTPRPTAHAGAAPGTPRPTTTPTARPGGKSHPGAAAGTARTATPTVGEVATSTPVPTTAVTVTPTLAPTLAPTPAATLPPAATPTTAATLAP
jgi:putative peptide zinc metalloprotease protein